MRDLAEFAGSAGRHHDHAPDCGHVEPETLAGPQSGRSYDLDLGQLLVPVTDAINGLGAEMDAAPEFTDLEFRAFRNGAKYMSIAPGRWHTRGVER